MSQAAGEMSSTYPYCENSLSALNDLGILLLPSSSIFRGTTAHGSERCVGHGSPWTGPCGPRRSRSLLQGVGVPLAPQPTGSREPSRP